MALNISDSGRVDVGAESDEVGHAKADWALWINANGTHVVGDRIGATFPVNAVVT